MEFYIEFGFVSNTNFLKDLLTFLGHTRFINR